MLGVKYPCLGFSNSWVLKNEGRSRDLELHLYDTWPFLGHLVGWLRYCFFLLLFPKGVMKNFDLSWLCLFPHRYRNLPNFYLLYTNRIKNNACFRQSRTHFSYEGKTGKKCDLVTGSSKDKSINNHIYWKLLTRSFHWYGCSKAYL